MEHQNREVTNRISDELKVTANVISTKVNDNIQPVISVNQERYVDIIRDAERSATGSGSLYTTPTDKDFYLTGVWLSNQSTVVCDNVYIEIYCYIGTAPRRLIRLVKPSVTAFSDAKFVSFPTPIKVTRGTSIDINSVFSAGASVSYGILYGYTVETLQR